MMLVDPHMFYPTHWQNWNIANQNTQAFFVTLVNKINFVTL